MPEPTPRSRARSIIIFSIGLLLTAALLLALYGCGADMQGTIDRAKEKQANICLQAEQVMAEAEAQGLNADNSANYAKVQARYDRLCT